MLAFTKKIRAALTRTPAKPAPRARLQVETLEERTVPTVGFKSALGGDTIFWQQGNGAGQPANQVVTAPITYNPGVLNNPEVDLIFWGKSWTQATAQQYYNDAKTMLQSSYTSALKDYGSDGLARIGGFTIDNSQAPTLGPVAATQEVQKIVPTMAGWAKPTQTSAVSSPIYVVVFDNGGGNGGNGPDKYVPPPVKQQHTPPRSQPPSQPVLAMNHIWMGGNAGEDAFTEILSHEIAERISAGVGGILMKATNANTDGEFQNAQIADNEPDGPYNYRINGSVAVQAYWSLAAKEFVVPDGDPGHLYELTPSWSNVSTNPSFNGTFTLTLTPAPGDTITLSETKDGNGNNVINVTWNGHTDTFDSDVNKLTGIAVNLPQGRATVNVQGSVSDVPVTITVGGSGTSSNVTVGDGNVRGMNSPVTVTSTGGTVNLTVDDSADNSGPTANLALGSGTDKLTGLGTGGVTFSAANVTPTIRIGQGSLTVDDSASTADRAINVSKSAVTVGVWAPTVIGYSGRLSVLKVVGGSGNDSFQVDSTAAGTQTVLAPGTGTNSVFVGEDGMSARAYQDYTPGWTALQRQYNLVTRHTLADIAGPVNVQANASGKTSLTVDDSGEIRSANVSSSGVTFSGVPTISYSSLHDLTLVTGPENPSVYVGGVPSGVPVTLYNDVRSQVWGPAASQMKVIGGLPSWDGNHMLPYYAYVPTLTNWNLPTPDPYVGYNPGIQESQLVTKTGVLQNSVAQTLVKQSTVAQSVVASSFATQAVARSTSALAVGLYQFTVAM